MSCPYVYMMYPTFHSHLVPSSTFDGSKSHGILFFSSPFQSKGLLLPFSIQGASPTSSASFLYATLEPHVPSQTPITNWSSPLDQYLTIAPINARWLIARNSWGVLSTISNGLGGVPYGNVVSFSDGEQGHGFGIPFFYLETLEAVGNDAINKSLAALTVSEAQLEACIAAIQYPKCTRVTLTVKLKWISLKDPEVKFAQIALFTKHPEIIDWTGNFQIYKLDVENIFLVNDFGKPKQITLKDYLKVPPM